MTISIFVPKFKSYPNFLNVSNKHNSSERNFKSGKPMIIGQDYVCNRLMSPVQGWLFLNFRCETSEWQLLVKLYIYIFRDFELKLHFSFLPLCDGISIFHSITIFSWYSEKHFATTVNTKSDTIQTSLQAHIDKGLKCLESYREKCLGKRVIRDNQANATKQRISRESRILWPTV